MQYSTINYDFPGGSDSKETTSSARDLGSIPGLGRSPGGGHGNPLQYFCLENAHGQRSLVGYHPWGLKESDTTGSWTTVTLHWLAWYLPFPMGVIRSQRFTFPPGIITICLRNSLQHSLWFSIWRRVFFVVKTMSLLFTVEATLVGCKHLGWEGFL